MDNRFINKLSKRTLKEIFNACGDEDSSLKLAVLNRLEYIKMVDSGDEDFSSDRMPEGSDDTSEKCNEILQQLSIVKFPFLVDTFYGNKGSNGNRRIGIETYFSRCFNQSLLSSSLSDLYSFFEIGNCKGYYESTYNTLNYIKNYICMCLATNGELVTTDLFNDYDEKKKLVAERIDDISDYIHDVKDGTKLILSTGGRSIAKTSNGNYKRINRSILIDSVAFGGDLEQLEDGNYVSAKRLLYLPRGTKK